MEEEEMQLQEEWLRGVVSINDRLLGMVGAWDRADSTELVKIWITTHASAPFDDFARRLENYFWRLWSCRNLMQSLSGRQIHAHVTAISEGNNIRTTPRGSPRASRDIQVYYTTPQTMNPPAAVQPSSLPPSAAAVLSPTTLREDDDGTSTPTAMSPENASERLAHERRERRRLYPIRPPPILKKTGSSGSSRSTSSRSPVIGTSQVIAESSRIGPNNVPDLSSTIGDQSPITSTGSPPTPRYTSTRFSEEVAVSIPQSLSGMSREGEERSPRSFGDSSRGSSKRSHVVHSGSIASRKRPIVMRQRSSQASSAGKSSPTSPNIGSQQKTDDESESLKTAVVIQKRRRAVSPHPDKLSRQASVTVPSEDEDEEEDDDGSEESPTEEPKVERGKTAEMKSDENVKEYTPLTQVASPLVDPNFRSKFALQGRSQQHRSFTNLPSAAWRSTTTTSTATSYNASGMMFPEQSSSSGRRGSGRAAFKDEIVPLKAPAPAGPDITDDPEDATALPRTKSQLTLLLERNKAAGHGPKGRGPTKQ